MPPLHLQQLPFSLLFKFNLQNTYTSFSSCLMEELDFISYLHGWKFWIRLHLQSLSGYCPNFSKYLFLGHLHPTAFEGYFENE